MNENTLERIVTGFIMLVIAILLALVDSFLVTWFVLGLVYLIAFREACKLFQTENTMIYVLALGVWIAAGLSASPEYLGVLVVLGLVAMMAHQKQMDETLLKPFLYPTISMLFLLSLYVSAGMPALIWLVLIVALTDTGAFIVGKNFGKTPFSPTSPNKTWEGVAGGIAVATLAGAFFGMASVGFLSALLIAFLTSVASVWGDLYESYLKREAEVKDSGTIFPGHGGMLDRLDGYLFGGVVLFVLLKSFV
ncbi:MAG: phosphatidate cytidylyltransferase [Campylobacterales bacterium]|nr:phosphatidate cytidylyltransferase [Campylobacterales bacterium]